MLTNNLITAFKEGRFDKKLVDLYDDPSQLDYQRNRYIKAIERYVAAYGDDQVEIYSVPGRSEVGGNHTDHQRGKVLTCALNLDMIAVVKPDRHISMISNNRKVPFIRIDKLEKTDGDERSTVGLVKGVLYKLEQEGYRIGGFKCWMTSDVQAGSGLSSSAAFEVMVGTIINGLYNNMRIEPLVLAKIGQFAENVYFGKPCGLMDQCGCAFGGLVKIDFEDISNPLTQPVNVDFSAYGYSMCIVDTRGSHASLTGEYAAIPAELKSICTYFGKEVLREVPFEDFMANIVSLREKCGDRAVLRALHVYKENGRVDAEVQALNKGDFQGFLKVITESGNSSYKYLQNIYASSNPNNQAVSLALQLSEMIIADHGACRVHGGGFAGTILAIVENDYVPTYKAEIEKVFGQGACQVLKVRKYGGYQFI